MRVLRYHIGSVLEDVCGKVSSVVDNVFSGNRPKATPVQMEDFVVVSVPAGLNDKYVCQDGTMRFSLFVREKENGIENTKRLSDMLSSLASVFPIVEKRYSVTKPKVVMRGADGTGFSVWHVQASMRINTTDSYVYN